MNSANLQLEGLYLAVAAINETLVRKGLLSRQELVDALRLAEQTALGDDRAVEALRPAERDAVAFPARLLLAAGTLSEADSLPTFSELARRVGASKPPHNDQA